MGKSMSRFFCAEDATARAISFKIRENDSYYYPNSAWRCRSLRRYKFQAQLGVLNLDAYVFYYWLTTGVTPVIEEEND